MVPKAKLLKMLFRQAFKPVKITRRWGRLALLGAVAPSPTSRRWASARIGVALQSAPTDGEDTAPFVHVREHGARRAWIYTTASLTRR